MVLHLNNQTSGGHIKTVVLKTKIITYQICVYICPHVWMDGCMYVCMCMYVHVCMHA